MAVRWVLQTVVYLAVNLVDGMAVQWAARSAALMAEPMAVTTVVPRVEPKAALRVEN